MGREYFRKTPIPPSGSLEGEFMFLEDFEGGFDWTYDRSMGSEMYKAPEAAYRGDYGVFLQTKTIGPATGDFMAIRRYSFVNSAPIMDAFFYIKPVEVGGKLYLSFDLEGGFFGGEEHYKLGWYINNDTKKVYIWDHNGAWVEVATLSTPLIEIWNYMDVMFDLRERKYIQLRIGDLTIDLSQYKFQVADGARFYLLPRIMIKALDNNYVKAYVDNVGIRPIG